MTVQDPTRLTAGAQAWEIIVGTLSYFVAGSLFIVLAMTIQLDILIKLLLVILGLLLLLCAPISIILTFWTSSTPVASKIHTMGKPILLVATMLSATNAMVSIIQLFGGISWQSSVYAWYMVVFLLLFIAAMIVFYIRIRR